jgi:hypothetical protein
VNVEPMLENTAKVQVERCTESEVVVDHLLRLVDSEVAEAADTAARCVQSTQRGARSEAGCRYKPRVREQPLQFPRRYCLDLLITVPIWGSHHNQEICR